MIPVSLTIQGLYSYQKKQRIDFEKLTSAHIFGIFGSVGCGKSSILEAITFALYGKTDRLNVSGDQRNYNMMNLKSDELLIDFIFQAGKPLEEYRIVVRGKRNRNNYEDVKAFDRLFYRKNGHDWIPEDAGSIDAIIGLSYDNFRRTIIIPQGKFQEFLQLGDKDRTQMMKDLFRLDRFDLFYPVNNLEKINDEKLQNIEGQLEQLMEVSQEAIHGFEQNEKDLRSAIHEKQDSLEKLKGEESLLQEVRSLFDQLTGARQKHDLLEVQRGSFEQLQEKLIRYERCRNQFKAGIDRLDELKKGIVKLSDEISVNEIALSRQQEDLGRSRENFNRAKEKYINREKLIQEAEDLKRILNVLDLGKQERSFTEKQKSLALSLKEINERHTSSQDELKSLKIQIQSLRKGMPDLPLLTAIRDWHSDRSRLEDKKSETEAECKQLEEELKKQEAAVRSVRERFSQWRDVADSATGEELKIALEKAEHELGVRLAGLDSRIGHLITQQKLKDYVDEITKGNPCPLCGSRDHPAIMNVARVEEELGRSRQEKQTLATLLGEIQKAGQLLAQKMEQITDFNRKKSGKDNQLLTLLTSLAAHERKFLWPAYKGTSPEAIHKLIADTIHSQKLIADLEEKLAGKEKTDEGLMTERENLILKMTDAEKQISALQAQSDLLIAQLTVKNPADYRSVPQEAIAREITGLRDRYQTAEIDYHKAEEQKVQLEKDLDTLAGILQNQHSTLAENQKLAGESLNGLEEKARHSGYADLEAVRHILTEELDLEKEKQRLDTYLGQYRDSSRELAELKRKTEGKAYDQEKHRKIREDIMALDTSLQDMNRQLGGILATIIRLKDGMKKKKTLEQSQKELKMRGEELGELKSLFRSSGFVNYISSIYMKNLCAAANDRFYKLTRQNLMLELTGDNNFQVRDFLNGGKIRSIKTLSGGQTFQAALSLALALAGSIQAVYRSDQNFFFLDEGFGTLDRESLSVVFDTLKSLRKENRIVGVISHVEEMQQEIETHLKIVHDPDQGSLITASWENS